MLTIIIATLAGIFITLTLLPLSSSPVWWVRGADFPRVQLTAIGAGVAVLALSLLDHRSAITWLIVGTTAAAIAYQLIWILPYTRLYRREVRDTREPSVPDRFRILSANVLMTNQQAASFVKIVREEKPHVLVTLETNRWWEEQLQTLESEYPHRLACPLENLYGMHLYSRFPLEDPKIQFLVEKEVPSMHTLVVLPSGRRVCLHCLHPAPPSPTENETSRERDAELVMVGRSVARAKFPVIVCGDLNDVAWSATTRLFRKVSRLLDPRIGRGMYNTFHASHRFCRWPVDHFFHSNDFTLVRLARLPAFGSDHFPVLIELQWTPAEAAKQKAPKPDAGDQSQAEQKMSEEAVSGEEVHRPGEGNGSQHRP